MSLNYVYYAEASRLTFPRVDPQGEFYRDTLILANQLRSLSLNIRSFREPLHFSIKNVIIPSIQKTFAMEGRPPWPQLSPFTVLDRKSAHPILRRTGFMYRKATQLNIWKIDRDSAAVSYLDIRVHYAKYHQRGTTKMPPRPFLQITDEDQDEIVEVFYEWFVYRQMRKFDLA